MSNATIRGTGRGYTVILNDVIRDGRLSLKALGFYATLKSFPDSWEYSVKGLAARCGVGRDAIQGCIRELEAAGYLVREQAHDGKGRFGSVSYVLRDEPPEDEDAPLTENPSTVEPQTASPLTGLPLTEKPLTVNPTQVNKLLSNYQSKITPPISPPEGGLTDELFNRFWAAYPRKVAKQDAKKAWDKLRPDIPLCRRMAAALERQKRSDQWRRDGGRYIPLPATWLNGRRWEDEDAAPPAAESPGRVVEQEGVTYF